MSENNQQRQVCIYCKNFPCMDVDRTATITTELRASYTFVCERDDIKPCFGENFESIFGAFDEHGNRVSADLKAPVATPQQDRKTEEEAQELSLGSVEPIQSRVNNWATIVPQKTKRTMIIKATNEVDMRRQISEATKEFQLDHKLVSLTSVFDAQSAMMSFLVALEVWE